MLGLLWHVHKTSMFNSFCLTFPEAISVIKDVMEVVQILTIPNLPVHNYWNGECKFYIV